MPDRPATRGFDVLSFPVMAGQMRSHVAMPSAQLSGFTISNRTEVKHTVPARFTGLPTVKPVWHGAIPIHIVRGILPTPQDMPAGRRRGAAGL